MSIFDPGITTGPTPTDTGASLDPQTLAKIVASILSGSPAGPMQGPGAPPAPNMPLAPPTAPPDGGSGPVSQAQGQAGGAGLFGDKFTQASGWQGLLGPYASDQAAAPSAPPPGAGTAPAPLTGAPAPANPALQGVLNAIAAQKQAAQQATQGQISALNTSPPKPRSQTLLELLATAIMGGLDRSGQVASGFQRGLNQGIQQKYANDMAVYNRNQQVAALKGQLGTTGANSDLESAQLQYSEKSQQDAEQAKADAQKAEIASREKIAGMGMQGKTSMADKKQIATIENNLLTGKIEDPKDRLAAIQQAESLRGLPYSDDMKALLLAPTIKGTKDQSVIDKNNAQTETDNRIREAKVQNLIASGHLKEAQTENQKSLPAYRQAMLGMMGKNYSSLINERDYNEQIASKRLDIESQRLADGKAASISKLQDAASKFGDAAKGLQGEQTAIKNSLAAYAPDGDYPNPDKYMAAQKAALINANKIAINQGQLKRSMDAISAAKQMQAQSAPAATPMQGSLGGGGVGPVTVNPTQIPSTAKGVHAGSRMFGYTVHPGEEKLFAQAQDAIQRGAPQDAVLKRLAGLIKRPQGG